jgi:hypothetical protein
VANFTRVKPSGWALYDVLESALMNALDIDHTKAPNFDDGSTHAPSAPVIVNGAGMEFGGPVLFDVGSDPHIASGVTAHIDSGAELHVDGLLGIRANSGSSVKFESGSFLIGSPKITIGADPASTFSMGNTGSFSSNVFQAIGSAPSFVGPITFTGALLRGTTGRLPFRRASVSTSTPQTLLTTKEVYRIPTTLGADQVLQVVDGLEDGDWVLLYRNGSPDAHKSDIDLGVTNPQTFTMPNSTKCWGLFVWNASTVAYEVAAGSVAFAGF